MSIPTEPIGSIPRPAQLLDVIALAGGNHEDRDSTHSADVDYTERLPSLFQ